MSRPALALWSDGLRSYVGPLRAAAARCTRTLAQFPAAAPRALHPPPIPPVRFLPLSISPSPNPPGDLVARYRERNTLTCRAQCRVWGKTRVRTAQLLR